MIRAVAESPIDTLVHWEQHGAVWRATWVTETEAVGFSLPAVAPSGGRIMIFDDDRGLQQKAASFRRQGESVIVYENALIWLHPNLPADHVAQVRAALGRGR